MSSAPAGRPATEETAGLESTFGRGAAAFRRRLALGGLLAIVLLVALGTFLAWEQYDEGKEEALKDRRARVVLASNVFDTTFTGRMAVLESVAAAPVMQSDDTEAMSRYFRRIQGSPRNEQLFSGGLGWIDATGISRASDTNPGGMRISVADRDYFKEAIKGTPFISEALTSRLRKQRIMVMTVPTRDADGKITGVLAGSVQFEPQPESQETVDLGFEGLTVLDRKGQFVEVVERDPPSNQELVAKLREATEPGVVTGKGLAGDGGRVVAFANAAVPKWTVAIDQPQSEVFASARRSLILELAAIGLAAAIALGLLAWAVVRSHRELESEREHVRRWDELSQSLGEASAPAEVTGALVAALATAFPPACVIVALEEEDRPVLTIAASRPGEDGPRLDRDDPVTMEIARLPYVSGKIVSARNGDAVRETVPRLAEEIAPQVGSLYAVPLLTRGGRPIGSVALLLSAEQALGETDERLVAAQAEHAGRALTRAQRYEQEHDVATALQRSLLPDTLPQMEGLDVAGRYSAGGVGLEVGGDWYDALRRPDGIIHFTVGDVAGRGISAAVLMGQLRNAYRALAYEHSSPAEIARRLLRHVPDAGMATAVFLTLDPYTGRFAYSSAGHPPTLMYERATGAVRSLDGASSPPLGWAVGEAITEQTLALTPGTTLLAYTDGLVERRGFSIDEGIERVRSLLRETVGRSAREACDVVLERVLATSPVDDDMALLLVRVTEVPATMTIEVPSDPAMLRGMRLRVGTWLERRGVGEAHRSDTVLAITEACNNAIEHGYRGQSGTIRLTLEHRSGKLSISVEDRGLWREPRADPTRGRGLVIMKSTMHRAEVTPTRTGTRVELELRLPGPRVAPLDPRPGSTQPTRG